MKTFKIRGGLDDSAVANTDAKLQDNLYLATNSKWLEKAEIPADRPMIGSFTELDIKIKKQLLQDFDDFASNNKVLPKIANLDKAVQLYQLALNFKQRDAQGANPIQADLKKLTSLKNFSDFDEHTVDLVKSVLAFPFNLSVDVDMKNTTKNALYFGSPETFLPDAGNYRDSSADELLSIFEKQSVQLLKLAGFNENDSKKYAASAIKFDKLLAQYKKSQEELNDIAAAYNPYPLSDFKAAFTNLNIDQLLNGLLPNLPEKVIVIEPKFLEHINELLSPDNFEELKSWLIVSFINRYASYLSQEFREAAFTYDHAVYGAKELQSQAKQAYGIVNDVLGEVIGLYYGQTYFGPKAKADVEQMIKKILATYKTRLQNNDWLTPATQKQALKKLNAITLKIGYPDKLSDLYDQIQVSSDKSLYENIIAANQTKLVYNFSQLNEPVDRTLWGADLPANEINAGYNPTNNDITFPAGILQKPFYSLDNTLSENLGGIGAVIGHEITHAFDPNGSKFDEVGNIRNWWSDEDYAKFNELSQAEITLFDGIVCGGIKTNGNLTVGENVADLGGLAAAVETAKKENGNLQEVFQSWAKIWRGKMTPQIRKTLISYDPHAPRELRVNVAAQSIDDFYTAFNIKPGDGMWLDPEKRVHIW
ncbi:M13 family metallopeptidase [Lactobacillus taiwanensis]|uniref:M13 family metallopeptidase n=1 Tax=Lactobacillus taiwanensis TaxID=508451 RepID=UPI002557F347|nr:M13 family metallopeptidase [Lactobacillus taiwanensis]